MPKISQLSQIAVVASVDLLAIVDVDESTTKNVEMGQIRPVGEVTDFAGTTAPAGWLFCYGQTLDATANPEYAPLFAVIGVGFGGTGINSFNLPDLRGRVVAGKDDMGGTSANRLTNQTGGLNGDNLGATGGAETHTLTIAQMPAHNHNVSYGNTLGTNAVIAAAGNTLGTGNSLFINNAGGGGAHNNVQPTAILNKIIKY